MVDFQDAIRLAGITKLTLQTARKELRDSTFVHLDLDNVLTTACDFLTRAGVEDAELTTVSNPALPKVMEALRHVNAQFPYVDQVVYDKEGNWMYFGEWFRFPTFTESINIDLLQEASDALADLPAAFNLDHE